MWVQHNMKKTERERLHMWKEGAGVMKGDRMLIVF